MKFKGEEMYFKFLTAISVCLVMMSQSFALQSPEGRGRASMAEQMRSAPRAAGVASVNQIAAAPVLGVAPIEATAEAITEVEQVTPEEALAVTPEVMQPAEKDMREKEKTACIGNNIGVGNTFVWASRYSNTNNYASMVEDLENPENNVCYVKVALKSSDPLISVDDIPTQYFDWGRTITCGSWADGDMLKQRILDAKKKNRTWATVGGAAGGAVLGVGIMEIGGNKLIGGKVMGQKNENLSEAQVLRSQMLTLKNKGDSEYGKYASHLKTLKDMCTDDARKDSDIDSMCSKYSSLFDLAE